ncbi:anaerobic ribonucleoside triphosphate reductase [Candidatus Nanosyncoccus alces]|uniref:Anaerobic ribonucleoside-triphosphate reductase n=1 Tax=Candidatus Nanosyncoccus alces TaxID=2171997 RepID=A0ABY0FM92_9BACT|nr:anaerobic ribonucleoside triphosphate reductase [Candidatus Nanosyncoccus alces]RYC74394.1 Anaerobic ribonucleoside-triphosphate reductase [Candidatus Nanosyncoccus alces]
MFKRIVKRDGKIVKFDPEKITDAIAKAGLVTEEFKADRAKALTEKVLKRAEEEITARTPNVEQIQDLVEEVLMESKFKKTAREYIRYRQERSRRREAKSDLMQIYRTISHADASEDSDVKRSNANVDGNSAMGKMLQFGAEGSKVFAKSLMLRPDIALAHDNGDIHIHDLDFYATGTLTCCQSDPFVLFENGGFNTGHGHLRTPNSIGSYGALAAILLQANQNEQHGGQSIPNFDYAMAPGVNKSFRKALKRNLGKYNKFVGKKLDLEIKDTYEYGDDKKLEKAKWPKEAIEASNEDVERETFQAMEGFIHNLNTMHSRAGAQVPFTSINFGTDTTPAGRLVSKYLLEATENGLGKGETPIFPISIFKVKEGVNYNPEDPNYDLFKKSMEVSSKRLFPNFCFIDAPYNLKYYKKGDYRTEIATMGCRTRVFASVFPESDGIVTGRGNLSFTTVNLVRIGIHHGICLGERKEADWQGFYKELDEKMDLVKDELLERFEFQANQHVRNFPFLMGQGNWFGSEKLGWDDTLREVIKHGTLSIGFIGLAETLVAMTGKHHGEDEDSRDLGLDIVAHMREKCDQYCKKYKLNFSLLATPAEGIAGRFTKIDRKEFGVIPGVTDREFYTNSFHVPVYYPISAFEKIEIEAPYHNLCNAGHITYIELDGDPSQNIAAFEAVIRKMHDEGIGYGSVNHPVDRDPVCGFSGIITGDRCPHCGRLEGDLPFEKVCNCAKGE